MNSIIFQIFVVLLFSVSCLCENYGILTVSSPSQVAGKYFGISASFGLPATLSRFPEGSLMEFADPLFACDELNKTKAAILAVYRGGNCTFQKKAENVMKAGVDGMIVFNDEDSLTVMSDSGQFKTSISAFMFTKSTGEKLSKYFPLQASLRNYIKPAFDYSSFIIFIIATITVMVGAYWASAPERAHIYDIVSTTNSISPSRQEEVTYLTMNSALFFIVGASFGLIIMFYFISSLIYVLLGVFCLAGFTSICACLYSFLRVYWTTYDYEISFAIFGEVNILGVITLVPSLVISIVWIIFRSAYWSWILQDIMAVCLLLALQRTIRLPNIKVSFTLLTMAFLYDIFWVFISPYFFTESVMIKVATGGSTGESIPMLIKIPRLNDEFGGFSLLGLGDIALPGLFVSFVMRFDYMHSKLVSFKSYFLIASVGYMFGLIFTFLGLYVMQSGQPALLYIVPCLLLPVFSAAWIRGDLSSLWDGPEIPRGLSVIGDPVSQGPFGHQMLPSNYEHDSNDNSPRDSVEESVVYPENHASTSELVHRAKS